MHDSNASLARKDKKRWSFITYQSIVKSAEYTNVLNSSYGLKQNINLLYYHMNTFSQLVFTVISVKNKLIVI